MVIKNKIVWMDILVEDLERAVKFYSAILDLRFTIEKFGSMEFGLCPHQDSESAFSLVKKENFKACNLNHCAPLIYLNVDGRIDKALEEVVKHGGKIIKDKEQIGPYGFRAIILDSEGNILALHSN